MAGGATQLSLVGVQDRYLHINATGGFFDFHHVTYEDFAIESIEITPTGTADFNKMARFKFMNNAELISGAYLEVTLPAIAATAAGGGLTYTVGWIHCLGFYLFNTIEFQVNANRIDIHYPEYLDMWSRLTIDGSKKEGYNDMMGEMNIFNDRFGFNETTYLGQTDPAAPQVRGATKPQFKIAVPIQFWWARDYSCAFPIGVLLFCEVHLNVDFANYTNLYIMYSDDGAGTYAVSATTITQPSIVDCKLYVDYVYMTRVARNRIAASKLFYIISQTRTNGPQSVSGSVFQYRLPFVMPVTELLFAVREDAAVTAKQYHFWDRYTDNAGNINDDTVYYNLPDPVIATATLKLLTDERESARDYQFFARYMPFKHHTAIPSTRGIWTYSFALYPEKIKPSGACNFSTSDNNHLNLTFNQTAGKNGGAAGIGTGAITGQLYVYATNVNYMYVNSGYLTIIYNA